MCCDILDAGRTDWEIATELGMTLAIAPGCRHTIRQRLSNVPFFEIRRLLENDLTTGAPRLNPPVSSFDH
jgi:hypothetical protein